MRNYLIVLIASWILIIGYFVYEENKEKEPIVFVQGGDIQKAQTIDSLQNLVDSLTFKALDYERQLFRYEEGYRIFIKRNPNAAEQFGNIMSDETE